MSRLRNLAPQAIRDVEDAAAWFAQGDGGPAVGRRYLAAVVEAIGWIERRPLLGHVRPELLSAPFRFRALTSFPYLLVYDAEQSPPRIYRVLHMARDLPNLLKDLDF